MSQKTNANINAKINEVLNQVDPNSITPGELKELMQDMKDSYANLLDHAKYFGLKEFDETLPYIAGQGVLREGRLAAMKRQYQGVFNAAYLTYLTPVNPLYSLPEWNSLAKPVGAIVRYEGDAYRNTVANNTANPTEEQSGWNAHNVAQGFFGEDFVQNQIYTPGNIVTATVNGRELLLRYTGQNASLITSSAQSEWLAGNFEFFAELSPSSPKEVSGSYSVSILDHGLTLLCGNAPTTIQLDALPSSFRCEIVVKGVETQTIVQTNGTLLTSDGPKVKDNGSVNVRGLGSGDGNDTYAITGDLEPLP